MVKGDLCVDFCISSEGRGVDARASMMFSEASRQFGFYTYRRGDESPSVGGHINEVLAQDWEWDWLFYLQEDHEQILPVDLPEGIEFLRSNPSLSLTRYMISGQRRANPAPIAGWPGWSELTPDCYEYFFALNPFLARRPFFDQMGPFSEHQSENRANARARELRLRFALHQPNAFHHIGTVPAMTEKHAARAAARVQEATC